MSEAHRWSTSRSLKMVSNPAIMVSLVFFELLNDSFNSSLLKLSYVSIVFRRPKSVLRSARRAKVIPRKGVGFGVSYKHCIKDCDSRNIAICDSQTPESLQSGHLR